MTTTEQASRRAPTPAQVDALVKKYADAKELSDAAKAAAQVMTAKTDEVKAELVQMVETFGRPYTQSSKRLSGLHNTATTTTAKRTLIDDDAVEGLRGYLEAQKLTEISGRFFIAHTTYSLVEAPAEVLKTLSLAKRVREKVASLIGLCLHVKTNAPSLKIETVNAVAP
jgi:hypothetical protein